MESLHLVSLINHVLLQVCESEDGQRLRFQVELEFVQCLANPNYLLFLAQRGYFKDQAFINYLKYLQYWKEPEYAKFLKYPMCLYFLDLLQYENFRKEIVNGQCCKFIDDQTVLHWQHYSRKRMKLLETGANQQGSQTPVSQSTAATGNPTPTTLPSSLINGHGQIQKV
ncbi:mediator of RNA polymerase II transcription subunit 31-like isoform X3 [Eriocheir sinensis]|uniref:mediator of RNA polymerase II transcription subunit 31-like isoform X3 n=1 Tax=Eriocheir sinensis TaxID=95602 RepID=UPI0021C98827|nr:mediator of RNA polymerase II transcription subunit 31-like isoform X3 [Eriocheir sinensis]XP_050732707.1 mediator of RNA polymerase II transcription subunit 31-like isoform X3 [Eriocheir sinensis]XP_050732708.1 mediator of RNA polymerase II transcription subunit 31-like isoform X3 [Eriocheir sinensis]